MLRYGQKKGPSKSSKTGFEERFFMRAIAPSIHTVTSEKKTKKLRSALTIFILIFFSIILFGVLHGF